MKTTDSFSRELIGAVIHKAWIEQDYAGIRPFFSKDVKIHGVVPGIGMTLDEYIDALAQICRLATVNAFTIEEFAGSHGVVAARIIFDITSAITGATAPMELAVFATIQDEQITRYSVTLDMMAYLEQAGLIHDDARMLLMTGQKLT